MPALRRAVCSGRRGCRVESVLPAGTGPDGARLAVVRVRLPGGCLGDGPAAQRDAYEDWLVAERRSRVRPLRQLVRGDTPCLEWVLSEWTFENGQLVFHYGAMGPPSGARVTEAERRRVRVYLRPWPLELLSKVVGTEVTASPDELPASGPLFMLTLE